MKRTVTITLAAVFLAVAGSAPATAQAGPPIQLQSDIRVHQKVRENGVERDIIAEPKVVVPGDRLVFRTTYRNLSKEAVRNFVISNAVPASVALSADSAAAGLVSVDGGKSWARLATLMVDDGTGGKRPAVASDVTHLRWVITEIPPGNQGEVIYQASVK